MEFWCSTVTILLGVQRSLEYATFFCKYVLSVSKLVFESFFVNCSKAMPTFMQLIFYQSKTPKPCQYFALLSQHGLSFKARRLKLYMSNNRTLGCVRLHAKFQPRRLNLLALKLRPCWGNKVKYWQGLSFKARRFNLWGWNFACSLTQPRVGLLDT